MNTTVRILCILHKFHHITDLLMNLVNKPRQSVDRINKMYCERSFQHAALNG